ncbi:hypothetical protein [Streptomyces platensis]|uniref:hypothetical protein n=1 Tax=Streptomyces platensis TaxID=58346 RepID=UPI001F46FEFB|nr:hypothetical protein [Streptomyces platensis]
MDGPQAVFGLEKGMTGFRDRHDRPLPGTDLTVCRTSWYAAARAARGGHVGDFWEREYPQNFHLATITDRDGRHFLQFHAHWPLVAFAADRRYQYSDAFREPPDWSAVLADAGFVVLSVAQLHAPLAECDTSALSDAELRQIRHWRPKTQGALLFNAWD